MIGRNRDYGPAAPTIGPARLIIVAFIGTALLIAKADDLLVKTGTILQSVITSTLCRD